MKRFIVAVVGSFVLWASPVSAWDVCKHVEEMAENIMKNRQAGASMSDMMEIANSTESEATRTVARHLVVKAYEMPRFSTEEHKRNIIIRFKNKAYLECYKALNK